MKCFFATLIAAFLFLSVQPPAVFAHGGNPDFKSEVTSITPSSLTDGLSLIVQDFDSHLELTNHTGKEVVVRGYEGEPYIRISASGEADVNLNSPAYYLNQDRYANVEVPARADAKAAPDWKEVSDTGQFVWHDHRSHYMGLGTPPQVKDESKKTRIFNYTIPLTVGGQPAKAHGTLIWVGKQTGFPFLPFLLLAIVAVAVGSFLIRRRRNLDRDEQGPEDDHGPQDDQGKQDDSDAALGKQGGIGEAW